MKKNGFTLVELSIVIVIIGFLVAGISAGSNMVKQAQLRTIVTDYESFQTAFNMFQGNYNALPGDMSFATSYWGGANRCSVTGTAAGDAACNGDGNGIIETDDDNTDESVAAWKHLQLAGLINTGISPVPDGPGALVPGVNIPASKMDGGFMISGSLNLTRTTTPFNLGLGGNAKNFIYMGQPADVANSIVAASLTVPEAFSLDEKLDDGHISSTDGGFKGHDTGRFQVFGGLFAPDICYHGSENGYAISRVGKNCVIALEVK